MKKGVLVLFLIVLFLQNSCSNKDDSSVSQRTIDSTGNLEDSLFLSNDAAGRENEDTLVSEKVTLIFEVTNKSDFVNADTSSSVMLDSTRIRKDGLKWIMKLNSGEEKNLLTDDTSDSDVYAKYYYLGRLKNTKMWLFQGVYYEANGYALIDMDTGEESSTMGYPVISPDQNYMVSGSLDLDAGFINNGIDLYEIRKGKLVQIFSKLLEKRGINEVRWLNKNTLVAEENHLVDKKQITQYVKIHLLFKQS